MLGKIKFADVMGEQIAGEFRGGIFEELMKDPILMEKLSLNDPSSNALNYLDSIKSDIAGSKACRRTRSFSRPLSRIKSIRIK